jgi:hypothetical protein
MTSNNSGDRTRPDCSFAEDVTRAAVRLGIASPYDPPIVDSLGEIPNAETRFVVGYRSLFVYIEFCPLCGVEHTHGSRELGCAMRDPLRPYKACNGQRIGHCDGADPGGLIVRQIKGGRYGLVPRPPPPEWHKPTGTGYRLVLGPKPACFTPRGFRSKQSRAAMARLERRGVLTSDDILRPRRPKFILSAD